MKEKLLELEKEGAPLSHIAFIMDGNRRWAKPHDLPLIEGYREGEKRIDPIVRKCMELDMQVVTFYTFSIDNLKRSEKEVKGLFRVLREGVPLMLHKLDKENVRFCSLGDISRFPTDIQDTVKEVGVLTQNNEGIIVNLALAYGGRDEIKRAVQGIVIGLLYLFTVPNFVNLA